MKQKYEKVLELTTISMAISNERAKEIAKNWSNKGLDFLKVMWHKYYTKLHHCCISSLILRFKEKELYLDKVEECLKDMEVKDYDH